MTTRRIVLLGISALVLAGCATMVVTRMPLDRMAAGNLKYDEVEVVSNLANLSPTAASRLKVSLMGRLAKIPQGGQQAKIRLTVTEFSIRSQSERFIAGALVGSNKMTVAVKIVDSVGNSVTDFDVQRSSNPGGYGAFYDQEAATIDAVADGVVEVLSGKK